VKFGRRVSAEAHRRINPRTYSMVTRTTGTITAGAKLHAAQIPSGLASGRVARQRVRRSVGPADSAAMDLPVDSTVNRLPKAAVEILRTET
jgi:hypothetical protein